MGENNSKRKEHICPVKSWRNVHSHSEPMYSRVKRHKDTTSQGSEAGRPTSHAWQVARYIGIFCGQVCSGHQSLTKHRRVKKEKMT